MLYRSHFIKRCSVGAHVVRELDRTGLVELAKSLAEETFRSLDDFCTDGVYANFIAGRGFEEEDEILQHLKEVPPSGDEDEDEKGMKERGPRLQPLSFSANPEARDAEKGKKVSSSKLSKRPPDLPEKKRQQMERKRLNKIDSRAKQKSEKKAARLTSRL